MAPITIAGRPCNDYADNWCSLFELFVSVSGLKLRLTIPDTVIIKDGRMIGWFYTNRDGVLCRCSLHEISTSQLFQKLVGTATIDAATNPHSYIALCHFESGVSRPLKQSELEYLAYIIPEHDLRYLTTYGGTQQASCTSFARRFSVRYTHVSDSPTPSMQASVPLAGDPDPAALTSDELVVESQLVAMGLLEPRGTQAHVGDDYYGDWPQASIGRSDAIEDAIIPASKAAKAEMARLVQSMVSYVERAHGLRMQALVAEFVQAHSQVFVLMAVHAVQWDAAATRGRLGTFTERWQDFRSGLGPPPAAQPPSRSAYAPGLLLAGEHDAVVVTDQSAGIGPNAVLLGGTEWLQRRPSLGRARRGGSTTQTSLNTRLVTDVRPGSAPAQVVHRMPSPHSTQYPGARNGYTSLRSAVASARPGAGGNPSLLAPAADSYALFTPNVAQLSTDTVAGSLLLEVERLKERLQRQTDVAARAEAALTQLAVSSQQTQAALKKQVEEARTAAEKAAQGRANIEAEYERLHQERAELNAKITALEVDLRNARNLLTEDRATLATTLRMATAKEEGLEDANARLRGDNDALTAQMSVLQRRLDEESELLEAARNQLYDYRQMVATLQSQLRRGKNKPVGAVSTSPGAAQPASGTSAVSMSGLAGAMQQQQPQLQAQNLGGYDTPDGAESIVDGADGTAGGQQLRNGRPIAKRPVNSPLNPAARAVIRSDTLTGGNRRQQDAADPGSSPDMGSSPATTVVSPRLGEGAGPLGGHTPAGFGSQAGGAGSAPRTTSPGLRLSLAGGDSSPQGGVPALPLDVLHRSPDPILDLLAEARRARKQGESISTTNYYTSALAPSSKGSDRRASDGMSGSGPVSGGSAGRQGKPMPRGETGDAAAAKAVVLRIDRRAQVKNPWTPNYEALHLNDLFTLTGELTERMADTLGHVLKLVRSFEPQFLEIFNYYASLGQVRHVDEKLIMVKKQYAKLAAAAGLDDGHGGASEPAEEVFTVVADRVGAYYFEFDDRASFITFPEFPELVCRMAATKYEWRPPDCPDDGEDDIAQPESLRSVHLANIFELPTANKYGVGPTAKPGTEAAGDSGHPLSPRTASAMTRDRSDNDGEDLTLISIVSQLGPQPPDVVLYVMIKTYILYELLPKTRILKTTGSRLSKQRSMSRTTPLDVWI